MIQYRTRNNELQIFHIAPIKGRFVEGNIPWNKGLKGSKYSGFQLPPGKDHPRYMEIGTIILRTNKNGSYYYIKIAENKFEKYHRYIWESVNGTIPKGICIVFKNYNTLDCSIDNLMAVTRSENMKRNFNREKAGKTLKEVWKRDKIRVKIGLPQLSKFKIN